MDTRPEDRTSNHTSCHISLNAQFEPFYQVFRQLGFPHLVLGAFYIVSHPVPFNGGGLVVIDRVAGAGVPVSWLTDAARVDYPTLFGQGKHGVFGELHELGSAFILQTDER